jgi:hypothetical protein
VEIEPDPHTLAFLQLEGQRRIVGSGMLRSVRGPMDWHTGWLV